jgi:hypothetical protein
LNGAVGKLTHVGGLTYRTLSLQDATLLVKTQWGGAVSCSDAEMDEYGRDSYHCADKQGTNTLNCLVPHIYFPNRSTRDPNGPNVPAVICAPGGGYKSPTATPKKNV